MTMQSLARKLAVARKKIAAQMPDRSIWPTPWEWIAELEEWQDAGRFSKELNFPKALAFYRVASTAMIETCFVDPAVGSLTTAWQQTNNRSQSDPITRCVWTTVNGPGNIASQWAIHFTV